MQNSKLIQVGFLVLLAIGIFFRIAKLGMIPVGLNADEASIGYEAYSLLKAGTDRWGIHLPPYFLSFGSGQNTMYAYLSVPFLYFFDLSQTSIRMLSAFLGLCGLPIVFVLAQYLFKNRIAVLACTILYLFDPYLFITSRWALEYNILPFFVVLSLWLFTKTFHDLQHSEKFNLSQKATLVFALPSLAFIIYTYASALFIVPVFLVFIIWYFWAAIFQQKKLFLISAVIFVLLMSPFILFILKNHILKSSLPFESYLPFEIPKMLSNREQVFKGIGQNLAIIKKNFVFIFSGFKEFDRSFNTTKFYSPHFFLIFSLIGLIFLGNIVLAKAEKHLGVLFFWTISCFVLFLFFEQNLNRSVHLQAVIPILSMVGLVYLFQNFVDLSFKKYLAIGFTTLFLVQSTVFYGEYFNRFPAYEQFVVDFEPAIKAASTNKKPNEKIAVTSSLVFNYLFVAFYEKFPPSEFQSTLKADYKHDNVDVKAFGPYIMLGDVANTGYYLNQTGIEDLKKATSFQVVLSKNESLENYKIDNKILIDSTLYNKNTIYKSAAWKVLRYTKK
jgi:4-amino-4-deoxy-L-arabinose transferase-like glycosyltransferase